MPTDEELRSCFSVKLLANHFIIIEVNKTVHNDEANYRAAQLINEDVLNIYKVASKDRFNILVDISTQKTGVRSLGNPTKNLYEKLTNNRQTRKIAVLGKNDIQEFVLNLVLAKKNPKVSWFSHKDEAILWLALP